MFSNRRIYWHRMCHLSEWEEWVCVRSHLEGSYLSYLFSYELLVWNWQGFIRCERGSLGGCTDSGGSGNTRGSVSVQTHMSVPERMCPRACMCVFSCTLMCAHPLITFFFICAHTCLWMCRGRYTMSVNGLRAYSGVHVCMNVPMCSWACALFFERGCVCGLVYTNPCHRPVMPV